MGREAAKKRRNYAPRPRLPEPSVIEERRRCKHRRRFFPGRQVTACGVGARTIHALQSRWVIGCRRSKIAAMKPLRLLSVALALGASAGGMFGQITFSTGSSSWGSGGLFNSGAVLTSGSAPTGAYYGGAQADANTYVFGFTSVAGAPTQTSHYDLSGTALTAGTALTLTFTGLSAAPGFVAYTGGALQSYSYSGGTLTMTVSTINPVASASDTSGAALESAFGLMIRTGLSENYSGTVFRTNMYWNDITVLQNYSGTSFIAGLNANGQNGASATFSAYLPTSFLNANGIFSPADCEAYLQKNSVAGVQLGGITREIYAGANPGFPNEGTVWTYGGASAFDFNGGGNDNFVLASYSNSSWSNGDIGIVAVPEPSAYAALFGACALLAALRRRRTAC